MAQTSSAQREPSMEEILASIRRIIEDSDAQKQAETPDAPSMPQAPSDNLPDAVEAFRSGIADEDDVEDLPEFREEFHRPEIFRAEPRFEPTIAEPPRAEPPMQAEPVSRGAEITPLHQRAPEFVADQPARRSDTALDDPALDASSAPVGPAATELTSIMSDEAGRQVSAAFGELSDAFAVNRRRGFDEMAREMMRPMLQEWLDNNLPTLVEKLVREEIERVARGG
jgi:cell pole-organizing protein PopZ